MNAKDAFREWFARKAKALDGIFVRAPVPDFVRVENGSDHRNDHTIVDEIYRVEKAGFAPANRSSREDITAFFEADPAGFYLAFDARESPARLIGYLDLFGSDPSDGLLDTLIHPPSPKMLRKLPGGTEIAPFVLPRRNWSGVLDIYVDSLVRDPHYPTDPIWHALLGAAARDLARKDGLWLRRIATFAVENEPSDDWTPEIANDPKRHGCKGAWLAKSICMSHDSGYLLLPKDRTLKRVLAQAVYTSRNQDPFLLKFLPVLATHLGRGGLVGGLTMLGRAFFPGVPWELVIPEFWQCAEAVMREPQPKYG